MSTDEELLAQVNAILMSRSQKALELAKQAILAEQFKAENLGEALRYFAEELFHDTSHPTLLSLACEAVGGDPDSTNDVAAAIALLCGAADVHDDIIDRSEIKGSKPTLYGKFGGDIAVIAADVLWIKGMLMLNEASEHFSDEKKEEILKLTKQAFFDIGGAEAKEISLHEKTDISPDEYLELINLKVSVATASAQIGALIGGGTTEQIEKLTQCGKNLGVLRTIREEFINMFEPDELSNRFKNECLPLPMLYAFKDAALKQRILEFIKREEITEEKLNEIIELVYSFPEVSKLLQRMQQFVEETTENLRYFNRGQNEFAILLKFTLQGLSA